ncbi:phage tail protein [Prescottella equi]
MEPEVKLVKLIGVGGDEFHLIGPNAGDRGVWLGTGLEGIYDPPVQVVYEEPANLPGARYLTHRILRRDVVFGVEILNDKGAGNSWLSRDSAWRKAFRYHRDCQLVVETAESGTRTLNMKLGQQPEISLHTDPNGNSVNRAIMTCVAGDPFWYGEEKVYVAKTVTDTTGGGTENLTIDTLDEPINPTDQMIWPVWVVHAPAKWTIPDYSWEDNELANRRLVLPGLTLNEDTVFHTDPRLPPAVSFSGTNVPGRMGGVRFRHPVPEYTGPGVFNISVTGAPIGSEIHLRLPRPWSRPWGLE